LRPWAALDGQRAGRPIVYDDLSKQAEALSPDLAAAPAPTGREATPATSSISISRLLERAPSSPTRWWRFLTALPIIETKAGDNLGLHPDQRDSRITDARSLGVGPLLRRVFARPSTSATRSHGSAVQPRSKPLKSVAGRLKLAPAPVSRALRPSPPSARTRQGSPSPTRPGYRLTELLQAAQNSRCPVEEQVMVVFTPEPPDGPTRCRSPRSAASRSNCVSTRGSHAWNCWDEIAVHRQASRDVGDRQGPADVPRRFGHREGRLRNGGGQERVLRPANPQRGNQRRRSPRPWS